MKVVITGASRGIGRSIAKAFNQEGNQLVLLARREEQLLSLAETLNAQNKNSKIEVLAIDLSIPDQIHALKSNPLFQDPIDLLINNLGRYEENFPDQNKVDELKKLMETNVYSAIELTEILLPKIRKSKQAQIVNIGSVMSVHAKTEASNYSISKHALKAWNDALREKLRRENIKVTAIYPGAVNTSSWDGLKAKRSDMIQAEDIAKLIETLSCLNRSSLVEEIHLSPLLF